MHRQDWLFFEKGKLRKYYNILHLNWAFHYHSLVPGMWLTFINDLWLWLLLLSQSSRFVSSLFMRLCDTLLGMTWVFTFYRTKALTRHERRTGYTNNVKKPLYLFLVFKGCTLCKEIWKFSSIPKQEIINLIVTRSLWLNLMVRPVSFTEHNQLQWFRCI